MQFVLKQFIFIENHLYYSLRLSHYTIVDSSSHSVSWFLITCFPISLSKSPPTSLSTPNCSHNSLGPNCSFKIFKLKYITHLIQMKKFQKKKLGSVPTYMYPTKGSSYFNTWYRSSPHPSWTNIHVSKM